MLSIRDHESLQRGSPDFPVEYYHLNQKHSRYVMPFHWHEEIELVHVISGEFDLVIDDSVSPLRAGDVAFISSGSLHGGTPKDAEYECAVADIRYLMKVGDSSRGLLSDILHRKFIPRSFLPKDSRYAKSARLFFEILREKNKAYQLRASGIMMELIGGFFADGAGYEPEAGEDYQRIMQLKKVFEFIENEYASDITLSDMAKKVNMTPKYFCKVFKQAVHRTPMEYLNLYRVETACYLLSTGKRNVTETSLDVGFNSTAYFIRIFGRYKGETPKQYARRFSGETHRE